MRTCFVHKKTLKNNDFLVQLFMSFSLASSQVTRLTAYDLLLCITRITHMTSVSQ